MTICFLLLALPCLAAYDLEVPVDPWDEYQLQFRKYSQQLLKSYDRAIVNDYEGAIAEATKAIDILPEEGLAYAERAKYYRTLNKQKDADRDFRKALTLFDQAIQRYKPGNSDKKPKKPTFRNVNETEAAKLIASIQYQRGETSFSLERYQQAKDDFVTSCKGGNAAACSRLKDVELIGKRGINWVPLLASQFYDRQKVERVSKDVFRVWVLREDLLQSQPDVAQAAKQQHLELNCNTRLFRLMEGFTVSGSGEKTSDTVDTATVRPTPGSAAGKLMVMLCSP
jgi:tetratricopeptide (TPR) repeat protein